MNTTEKVLIILICCVLFILLTLFTLHSRVMDRKFRRLQYRVEALEGKTIHTQNVQDGLLNWMKAVQAQVCDILPSCHKYDKMWLKGKTVCVNCGRWIKKKPCPHCGVEPCPIHGDGPCPELRR